MSALRIVVCCDAFLPADEEGGPPFSTFNLCEALSEAGADVRVVTTDRNGEKRLDVTTNRWTTYCEVPVWYARSLPGPYYPAPTAGRAIRSTHADCILSSGTLWTHLGFLAWRASRRRNTPVLMFPRGLLDPWALAYKQMRKRLYWRLLGKRILNEAAAVVALTEPERDAIRSLGVAQRIEVIPNGMRPEDFDHAGPLSELTESWPQLAGKPYVLFLGRIHEKKGVRALIDALGDRKLNNLDFHLVIAGPVDADYRRSLEQLVETCARQDRVVFTGPVTGRRKADLLAHAAAFVLPSLSEGLPVAVLEALASGCPVILSPACNLPEVAAAGAGIEVEPEPFPIAAAMAKLLQDAPLRYEMGQRGLALARERFDVRAIGERVLALCRDVMAKP